MRLPMTAELRSKIEKLRVEAAECDMIGNLADDSRKRELFCKLAKDLRSMARDLEAMIGDSNAKLNA